MSEPKLIQNAIWIPEDDVYIKSAHTHDYVTHTLRDGATISVDGGTEYARRVAGPDERFIYTMVLENRYEEYCLTTQDPFFHVAARLLWGVAEHLDSPLKYRPIKEFSLDHLRAILDKCPARSEWVDKVVRYWIRVKEMDLEKAAAAAQSTR